jgi:hypothetical protein
VAVKRYSVAVKRDQELSTRSEIREKAQKVADDVEKGFTDQNDRANDTKDLWDLYNCELTEKQFYNGTSEIFLPLVKDAVDARATRFTNQLFPQAGRYVEVTTAEDDPPFATMALIEHYIRRAKVRTEVAPPLSKNGDVEGQYSIYVDWEKQTRTVARRKQKAKVKSDGMEFEEFGTVETIEEEEIVDQGPTVEVLYDADLLILPATANTVDQALAMGGSVTIRRKWTKAEIARNIKEKRFAKDEGEALIEAMTRQAKANQKYDPKKEQAKAAGIKLGGKMAVGFEIWTRMKVDGDLRLVRIYYGGDRNILGVKLCPYWCDKCPVISTPVEKVAGVAKGKSQIEGGVADIQIFANDAINEAADTAHFSAMPIIMTDPVKNPKVGSMILGLAAIWETNPNDTKFAQFPELWKHGFDIVNACKSQIFESLGVNPSMVPQQTGVGGKKRNQAEIALEQQVDVLTTADAVTILEEGIFTPMVERFAEYDAQFRGSDPIVIRMFGEMGMQARMETLTDQLQLGTKYAYRWYGVEAARNAAQIQQQISLLATIAKIPPQQYPGYKLNMAPALVQAVETAFGPRIGPKVFISLAKQMTVDAEEENHMLEHGFEVHVHPGDDDLEHARVHMELFHETSDPHGNIRAHITQHQQAFKAKAEMAMQQQSGGAPPPGEGGGQVRPQAPGKRPPGSIHPDQMSRAGAPQVDRKSVV